MTPQADPELTVTVDRKPGSIAELHIHAPVEETHRAITEALEHVGRRIRLPGFRPGKVPAAVVERNLGWETIRDEAIDHLLPRLYERALSQTGLEAVGSPHVEDVTLERDSPPSFTVTVAVKPEVAITDLATLRVKRPHTEITEADVDKAIEEVRRRHSELIDVDRPAQGGDVVHCRMTLRRGEEVLTDGQESRDLELDRDNLTPGMADGIVGLSAGDKNSFEITLPNDHPREELRGANVTVDVEVEGIKERSLPPLDDDLAKLVKHGETLDELRAFHRADMEERAAQSDADEYESTVLEALRDRTVVDIPEPMVVREVDRQMHDLELRLAATGIRLDKYLEYSGRHEADLRSEFHDSAAARVKLQLALEAVVAQEGIEVDSSQVDREVDRVAGNRKLKPEQRGRLRKSAEQDLRLQAAAQRVMEIAEGAG